MSYPPGAGSGRSWLAIKYGHDNSYIRPPSMFKALVTEWLAAMNANGVLMEQSPLQPTLETLDEKEVLCAAINMDNAGLRRPPIMLLLTDRGDSSSLIETLSTQFLQRVYTFQFSAGELEGIARSQDLGLIDDICKEFVKLLMCVEGLGAYTLPSQTTHWLEQYNAQNNIRRRGFSPPPQMRELQQMQYHTPPQPVQPQPAQAVTPQNHRVQTEVEEDDSPNLAAVEKDARMMTGSVTTPTWSSSDTSSGEASGPATPSTTVSAGAATGEGGTATARVEAEKAGSEPPMSMDDLHYALQLADKGDGASVLFILRSVVFLNRLRAPFEPIEERVQLLEAVWRLCSLPACDSPNDAPARTALEETIEGGTLPSVISDCSAAAEVREHWTEQLLKAVEHSMHTFLVCMQRSCDGDLVMPVWRSFSECLQRLPDEFWSMCPENRVEWLKMNHQAIVSAVGAPALTAAPAPPAPAAPAAPLVPRGFRNKRAEQPLPVLEQHNHSDHSIEVQQASQQQLYHQPQNQSVQHQAQYQSARQECEPQPSVSAAVASGDWQRAWALKRNQDAQKVKEMERGSVDQPLPQQNGEGQEKEEEEASYTATGQEQFRPWLACEDREPPCDFREMPTRPIRQDIIDPVEAYIRRCVFSEPYKNAEHYLDVQFRLLREDLVSPLRDGLTLYKINGSSRGRRIAGDQKVYSDIQMYRNIRVHGMQVQQRHALPMRYIELPMAERNWQQLERSLRYGGMVCVSCDGFDKDIHIGVIVERKDDRLLQQGQLGVAFMDDSPRGEADGGGLLLHTPYDMAEPTSYLEAYEPVLTVLQKYSRFRPVPFERYVVKSETNVRRPRYMRVEESGEEKMEREKLTEYYEERRRRALDQHRRMMAEKQKQRRRPPSATPGRKAPFGMDDITGSSEESLVGAGDSLMPDWAREDAELRADRERERELSVSQLTDHVWIPPPMPDKLKQIQIGEKEYPVDRLLSEYTNDGLDEAQRVALCDALTQELALIQGPPGTGKTFIGVEIVRVMLANRLRWRHTRPILLVCYTNQALDQFMEKLVKMATVERAAGKIQHDGPVAVRLGSRSESEYLKKERCMRSDVMEDWREKISVQLQRNDRVYGEMRSAEDELLTAAVSLRVSSSRVLNYNCMTRAMTQPHADQLSTFRWQNEDSRGQPLSNDEALACWLLEKQYGREKELGQGRSGGKKMGKGGQTAAGADDSDSDFEDRKVEKRNADVARRQARNRGYESAAEMPPEEEEQQLTDEMLQKLFSNMQMSSGVAGENGEQTGGGSGDMEGLYEVDRDWDLQNGNMKYERQVVLFGEDKKKLAEAQFSKKEGTVDDRIVNDLREIEDQILRTAPMTAREASEVRNIMDLTRLLRWKLFAFWRMQLVRSIRSQIPSLIEAYSRCCAAVKKHTMEKDAEVMKSALIIGATTTGAAKSRELMEKIGCVTLIVEEAAEVLEAHIQAALLPSIQHAIFIGDHEQLKPKPTVFELGVTYGLETSLFERLIRHGHPYSQLRLQHRMLPALTSTVVRPHFYSNLLDAATVGEYPSVGGLGANLFFWAHDEKETSVNGASHQCDAEIEQAMALCTYLRQQNHYSTKQITIITTYSAQTAAMRKASAERFGLSSDNITPILAVETVDGFQGKENDIIILSLVRSHDPYGGPPNVGFLATKNRICVAWTRAKHGLYVLGNMNYLAEKSWLWRDIRTSMNNAGAVDWALPVKCRQHGKLQKIQYPCDFRRLCPDGGCDQPCDAKMPSCEHRCTRRCHPVDDHEIQRCYEPCQKTCANDKYKHPCSKECYADCGRCMTMVNAELRCGHVANVPCSCIEEATCQKRCEQRLLCGHQCAKKCGQECTVVCEELTDKHLPCGHTMRVPCNKRSERCECAHPCPQMLNCGHACGELCGQECTYECQVPVERLLGCGHVCAIACSLPKNKIKCKTVVAGVLACGHDVSVACHQQGDRAACSAVCKETLACGHMCKQQCGQCWKDGHQCTETCGKVLPCSHRCTRKCGAECVTCTADCRTRCSHQICGNGGSTDNKATCYGRTCESRCALCPRPCDNSCPHRSCSKRCWEVCDVKACDEPCEKRLRCGHACLGVCNETCPDVCGQCQSARYLSIVSVLGEKARIGIHRLIRLRCTHVFPVKFMDEHVSRSVKDACAPCCPREDCGEALGRSSRYARLIRKDVLHREMLKLYASLPSEAESAVRWAVAEKKLAAVQRDVHSKTSLLANKGHDAALRAGHVNSMVQQLRDSMTLGAGEACKLPFIEAMIGCAEAVVAVWSKQLAANIPNSIKKKQFEHLHAMSDAAEKDGKLLAGLLRLVDEMLSIMCCQLQWEQPGLILPRIRHMVVKAQFYHAYGKMIGDLMSRNADTDSQTVREVRHLIHCFLATGPAEDYVGAWERLCRTIHERILRPNRLEHMWEGRVFTPPNW